MTLASLSYFWSRLLFIVCVRPRDLKVYRFIVLVFISKLTFQCQMPPTLMAEENGQSMKNVTHDSSVTPGVTFAVSRCHVRTAAVLYCVRCIL